MGTIQGEGQFLLASHTGEGIRVYEANLGEKGVRSAVIHPLVKVPIDEEWLKVPAFARDVQKGTVVLERDEKVPDAGLPGLAPEFNLPPIQAALAKRIAYGEKIAPEVMDAINVHHLLGPGGMTPNGVRVTKQYAQREHTAFLRATLDLETRFRNRQKVKRVLQKALKEIEAL